MMRTIMFIAPLCAWAIAARCADTDEVKFRPQAYKPGKEIRAKTYTEKPYTVSDKAAAKTLGPLMPPAQVRQPEMTPFVAKDPLNGKPLAPPPPMQADPYREGDKVYASTISSNKTLVATKKPFVVTTNKLNNVAFVPVEKPKEKNPLLEPRQGIKILPTDDNR